MLDKRVMVFEVVLFRCDTCPNILPAIVLKRYEKDAIIFLVLAELLAELRCPIRARFRPFTFPTATSPWIPKLHKTLITALILELMNADDRI